MDVTISVCCEVPFAQTFNNVLLQQRSAPSPFVSLLCTGNTSAYLISCSAHINKPYSWHHFSTIKTNSSNSTLVGTVHELLHLLFTPSIMIIVRVLTYTQPGKWRSGTASFYIRGTIEFSEILPFRSFFTVNSINSDNCRIKHNWRRNIMSSAGGEGRPIRSLNEMDRRELKIERQTAEKEASQRAR